MTDQAPPEAPPERPMPANVIQALARVMEEMPGVGKDATAAPAQGGYSYRSIEAITAAAQHLLGRYGVVFVPKVVERRFPVVELTVNGKPWTEEQLTIVYTVYGPGGVDDRIEVGPLVALGRDNVDKGTNKAMTQAFKYALLQVLAIGDNKDDADAGSGQADSHGRQPVDPEQWFIDQGWMDRAHHDDRRAEIAKALADAGSHVKTAFRKWYDDQTEAPAWRAAWPQPFAQAVENALTRLVDEDPTDPGRPFEPATAPQEAQEAPGPNPHPEPEPPAPGPHSAPSGPEGGAMPWDGVPDPGPAAKEAAEGRRKAAIVEHVNGLDTDAVSAALEARQLALGGTGKARKERLAKAMVAEGWTPSRG